MFKNSKSKVIRIENKNKEKDTKYKVDNSENGELSRLRNHNQALLTQIKKLKDDKKSLNEKIEQLQEVVSNSLVISVKVEDKKTNIDPVKIITQAKNKPTEVKTQVEFAVQTMDIANDDSIDNSTTTTP